MPIGIEQQRRDEQDIKRINVTLPNGQVIEGIPEGTSKDEIAQKAISAGIASPEDFGQSQYDPTAGGSTLQFFGLDTGIPTSQTVDRALSGAGRAISNVYGRGPKDIALEARAAAADVGADAGIVDPETAQRYEQASQEYDQEIEEARRRDEPLMDTNAGFYGNIGGNVAAAAAPGGLVRNTLAGATKLGAAYGALQPTVSGESRTQNTAVGAGAGGLGYGVIVGGGALAGFPSRAMEPLTAKGQQKIVGGVMRREAGEQADDVVRALRSAPEYVPGSRPTVGQASGSGGLASLERATAAVRPEQHTRRMLEQNAARIRAMDEAAGDAAQRQAAAQARRQATTPLVQQVSKSEGQVDPTRVANLIDRIIKKAPAREQLTSQLNKVRNTLFDHYPQAQRGSDAWKQITKDMKLRMSGADKNTLRKARTVMDRVRKESIDPDEALEQLKGLKPTSATANSTLQYVRDQMKTPEWVLRESPEALKSASQNIGDMINAKGPTGGKINEAIVRELSTVKKSLDRQIAKAEPAYGQYMSQFREMSKPLNQMDTAQEIVKRATTPTVDALGNPTVTPRAMTQALRSGDQLARRATGFKRARLENTLSPEQLQTFRAVGDDLSRAQVGQNLGRGAGSNTVQNLAMSHVGGGSGVGPPTLLSRPAMIANYLRRVFYDKADQEMQEQLMDAMLDPQKAAQLMEKAAPSATQRVLSPMGALLRRGGAVGGAVGSQD